MCHIIVRYVISVERIEVRVCEDLINLERADAALFIIHECTALNALPV